jgi:hypothetical protein
MSNINSLGGGIENILSNLGQGNQNNLFGSLGQSSTNNVNFSNGGIDAVTAVLSSPIGKVATNTVAKGIESIAPKKPAKTKAGKFIRAAFSMLAERVRFLPQALSSAMKIARAFSGDPTAIMNLNKDDLKTIWKSSLFGNVSDFSRHLKAQQ